MRVVALVLVAAVLVAAAPVVAGQETQREGIHISDVNVTPDTPQVGETVTVTTTVKNDGTESFDLSQVSIVRWDEGETVSATNLGTVAEDESIEVPLTLTFKEMGTKTFEVRASGSGSNIGSVQYPVSVEITGNRVDVEASVDAAAVGAWTPVEVEVSNGGASEIRGLRATAEGYGFTTEEDGFVSNISPGETETMDVLISSDTTGVKDVTASVRYADGDGNSLTAEDDVTVRFEERDHDLSLRASTSENGVEVTVANLGNAAVQNVRVRGGSALTPVEVGDVDALSSETVDMNVTGVKHERTLELTATYELGEQRRSETATVGYAPRSNVRLTGTSVEGAGTLTVTGSASNVGIEDAEGVVVEVVETENVEPAPPQSDYFVGTVPASDFGTFELNARTTGNVSEIPVRVSYVADGESYDRVQNVSYAGVGAGVGATAGMEGPGTEESSDGPSNSGVPTWLFATLILLIVGVVGYGWRRRG